MAAWDVAAEAVAPAPRPRPKPKAAAPKRARPAARRRVTGGVVWIVVVAVLLTGIVALNVAVLRLNVQLDRLSRERANLRAENAVLQSQLSSAASTQQIQKLAQTRLGLRPADPDSTLYVDLGSRPRR
ncbi:MAG TPA: cell division protein FtsL [Gaiellaceae bacterium]